MDENLSFYLAALAVAGRWLSSAVPGRGTPDRAADARELQPSTRGKRRGLDVSQLFDASKSCGTFVF